MRGPFTATTRAPLVRPLLLPAALSLSCALVAFDGARAWAQGSPRYQLTVRATERAAQCPDLATTRAAVRERLAYDPFSPDAPASIELRYARDARWSATILVRAPGRARPATRTLRSRASGCESLGSAVSLAIAIAIDPTAAAAAARANESNRERATRPLWSFGSVAGSSPTGAGAARTPAAVPAAVLPARAWTTVAIAPAVLSTHTGRAPERLRWHGVIGLGAWVPAAVPTVVVGPTALAPLAVLGVGAQWRRLIARVEVGAHWPASIARDADSVLLWNVFSSLIACADLGSSFRACGATQLSLTGASQSALDVVDASTAWGFALGARVAWEPRLGRSPVALSIAAEGLGWLLAPTLRIDGSALWTRPRGTAGIDLGVVVHF